MFNIWYLLLHSLNISLVTLLILALKHLFKDLLSARWQYCVWSVLVLRMIIPSASSRYIFLPLTKYIEMLRFTVEQGAGSAYTDFYSLLNADFSLPESFMPVSVTDYLFMFYLAGVLLSLVYYSVSYFRLRALLKKGSFVPDDVRREINLIAGRYNLISPKRVVYVKGLPSAFICGIIKPVLALPEGNETDEKIILHELLHLRNADTLKSAFWCFVKCINWFNPLMHYAFNVIGNDIEALCDLRTLEKLEGEQRREYGKILLSMVNERYQRVPCTSSASNGGKNIARRIDSIVKFKKYPKGMSLVSVCIVFMMCIPCIWGNAAEISEFTPETQTEFGLAVASARSARCTTMAGALDSYAKALVQKNGVMMLLATHEKDHSKIIEAMQKNSGETLYHYETGKEFDYYDITDSYKVFNIAQRDKNTYSAVLGFLFTETVEETICEIYGVEADDYRNYVFVPVTVSYDNGWVVTNEGQRSCVNEFMGSQYQPNFGVYEAKGKVGTYTFSYQNEFTVDNSYYADETSQMFGFASYNTLPNPSAVFNHVWDLRSVCYQVYEDKIADFYEKSISMQTRSFKTVEDYERFKADLDKNEKMLKVFLAEYDFPPGSDGGSESHTRIDSDWKGALTVAGGGGTSGGDVLNEYVWQEPAVEMAWIFSRGELIDEFTVFTKEGLEYDK